jgi:hypothetical protein
VINVSKEVDPPVIKGTFVLITLRDQVFNLRGIGHEGLGGHLALEDKQVSKEPVLHDRRLGVGEVVIGAHGTDWLIGTESEAPDGVGRAFND